MPRTYENKLRGGVCLLCSGNELEKEEPGPEINGDRFTGAFYFSRSGSPIPVCTGAYVRVGREAVDGFSKVHSIPPPFARVLLFFFFFHSSPLSAT